MEWSVRTSCRILPNILRHIGMALVDLIGTQWWKKSSISLNNNHMVLHEPWCPCLVSLPWTQYPSQVQWWTWIWWIWTYQAPWRHRWLCPDFLPRHMLVSFQMWYLYHNKPFLLRPRFKDQHLYIQWGLCDLTSQQWHPLARRLTVSPQVGLCHLIPHQGPHLMEDIINNRCILHNPLFPIRFNNHHNNLLPLSR